VWGLGLESQKGRKAWSKSGCRPTDIPGNPPVVYRDDGSNHHCLAECNGVEPS
jgi:hypothetical protein